MAGVNQLQCIRWYNTCSIRVHEYDFHVLSQLCLASNFYKPTRLLFDLLEGSGRIAMYMFWMKIITSFGLGILFHLIHAQQLYFFNNLGYSKKRLYIYTVALDLLIWLALTITTVLIIWKTYWNLIALNWSMKPAPYFRVFTWNVKLAKSLAY